jgi:hypothetical protein
MSALVTNFIDEGRFILNYQLIKLEYFPVEIQNPKNNLITVKEFMQELEIYSLKICKFLGMNTVEEGEEF